MGQWERPPVPLQVFLIVIGMIIAVPFALKYAGGWGNVVANVPEGTMSMFKEYSMFDIISLVIMYVATFSVGQEAVSRFYAAKDGRAAKGGAWLAAVINFVYAFIPTILGIITLALINMGKFNAADFEAVGARYALPVLAIEVYLDKFSGGNLFDIHFSQTIVPGLVAALIFFLIFSFIFPSKKDSTELAPDED